MLVWVYDCVRGAFPGGTAGGAVFGVCAGILINFPTWLFMTVYAGWPYRATWQLTLMLILLTIVSGTLAGLVYQKVGGTRSA